jgi:uncharacterized protein YqeY
MNVTDRKVAALRKQVNAAKQEFDMAVTFHETWKPAAYDKDLHKRMGVSFATHAFLIVRSALRREMLLALIRLWDNDERNVGMELSIADPLRDQSVVHALAAERAARRGMAEWEDEMRDELSQRASEAIALVEKYSEAGSHYVTLRKLRRLRNKRLAHRSVKAVAATGLAPTDEEIESFYQDNSKLVGLLLGLIEAVAYDPNDTAEDTRVNAKLFWAGVLGEKTEGHPNYRAQPVMPPYRRRLT